MCGALGGGLVCGPWDSGGDVMRILFLLLFALVFSLGLRIWLLGSAWWGPFGVILHVRLVGGL